MPKLKITEKASLISLGGLQNSKGKTIADFEYGTKELGPENHRAEAIIFYFTDGSRMSIDIGSNAFNLAQEHRGLKPENFRTDLIVMYSKDGKS